MGRFLNARAVSATPVVRAAPQRVPFATLATDTVTETVAAPAMEPAEPIASTPVAIGVYALCAYLISGYATDLSQRFLGTKPYVSMISGILVFACFLLSANGLAALRTRVGQLWLGMGLWMCVASIFSRWRGGSFGLMATYVPKQHMLLFYLAALVISVKYCRTVVRACILGSFILVLSCAFFGGPEPNSGRFVIASNVYLSNPNDLAMQLLVGIGFFLYWIRQPGLIGRVGGLMGALGAGYFLLRTGSRGGILAAVVLAAIWIFFSQNRLIIVGMTIPAMLLLVVLAPRQILHRLSLLTLHPDEELVTTVEDEKTVSSQMARTYLLQKSIEMTFHHPIFGVGPGEFSEALEARAKSEGRHEAAIGTHNTYTQISAECGTPALIMFVIAVAITIRSSYRLYKATVLDPKHEMYSSLAFLCFVLAVAYSIDIFFHHMAYYGNMPLILGLWIAVDLAWRRHQQASQAAAQVA